MIRIIISFIFFIFINSEEKYITLKLYQEKYWEIKNPFYINLLIKGVNISLIYSSINSKSDIFIGLTPYNDCNWLVSHNCHLNDNSKDKQVTKNIFFNGSNIQGKVYEENFSIKDYDIGNLDYIIGNFNQYPGLIHVGAEFLKKLKEKNIISNKIIFHDKNIGKIDTDLIIGKNYDVLKFQTYDICDLLENSGCKIKNIAISKTIENFQNNTNVTYLNFTNKTIVQFYHHDVNRYNSIIGPKRITSMIEQYLKNNSFTSEGEHYYCKNKFAFFIFGDKGIKFSDIYIHTDDSYDNLYFGYTSIENLEIIIDYEKNKIVFHSDSNSLIFNTTKNRTDDDTPVTPSHSKIWVFLVILFIIILIVIIAYFLIKWKFKDIKFNDITVSEPFNEIN